MVVETARELRPKIPNERDLDSDDQNALQQFNFYHGFLPREDLDSLLKQKGDYLLRLSEVEADDKQMKLEVILSVMATVDEEPSDVAKELSMSAKTTIELRSVVVRRVDDKYQVEPSHMFPTLAMLINFYKKTEGTIKKTHFKLLNPIGLVGWEYKHSEIELGKSIGEGEFGEVRSSNLVIGEKKFKVAVKLTKGTTELRKAQIKDLMLEARLMRKIRHRNVVHFYGIAVIEQPLLIILELVPDGGLKKYLESNKGKIDLAEKLSMCLGAARGVEHIHHNKIIHRDLATRNCLYTPQKEVKISDFGMARNGPTYTINSKNHAKLPIRWLAPETIESLSFSMKSDVYSYGVIVFEIFSDAAIPWGKMEHVEVKKAVISGESLTIPDSCPAALRDMIRKKVFVRDPANRASMAEVVKHLEAIEQQSEGEKKSSGRRRSASVEKSMKSTKSTKSASRNRSRRKSRMD